MAKRKETGKPIPQDWVEEDGYNLWMLCAPNSLMWDAYVKGAIYELTRGRGWDANTGTITEAQTIAKEIFESMAKCNDLIKSNRMLVAAILGESVDLTDPDALSPDQVDYTGQSQYTGLVPKLEQLLKTNNLIYPDQNIPEILSETLIGRSLDVGIPGEGEGIADILDERVQELSSRFIMDDASVWNPFFGTKNVPETLETLFRRDSVFDLELFLPNIVSMHEHLFKQVNTGLFAVLMQQLLAYLTGNEAEPVPEANTTAEILALIAANISKQATEPQPIDVSVAVDCGHGSGCGCGGGGTTPSDPGDQGGDPPPGWEEPTDDEGTPIDPGSDAYGDRKCKMSNIIHQLMVELITKINGSAIVQTAVDYMGDRASDFLIVGLTTLLGELATPVPFWDGVVGFVVGLALQLLLGDLNFAGLILTLNDNEEELVCALYNAESAANAINDYMQVLDDKGESLANRLLIGYILTYDVVNILYFKNSTFSLAFEATLETYNPPIDCSNCGCEHQITGTLISDDGTTLTVQATAWAGGYRFQVLFLDRCNPVTFTGYSVISGSLTPHPGGVHDWRIYSFENPSTPGSNGDIYSDDAPPTGFPYANVSELAINSGDPYTIEIYYAEEV